MKTSTLIFILIIFTNCISAQTSYFVNDVKYVNDVEINFCVDSVGRIYNVKVNKDFTDYQNEEVIQEIIGQMKGVTLYSVELFNNCYDELFTFINDSLQTSKVKEDDFKYLENFRKGKFAYTAPRLSKIKIIRRKNKQIEKEKDGIYKYEINWIPPNLYTLKYLKVGNKDLNHLIGEIIEVEIIRIIDEYSYIYKSTIKGMELYGIIEKK